MKPSLEFLQQLQKDIWEETGEVYSKLHRKHYMTYREKRLLTEEEWRNIWRTVDDHQLAVSVSNTDFGFRFGLFVWPAPVAPGVPLERDDCILSIGWDHLDIDTKGLSYDRKFEKMWEHCRPYFDTSGNIERLELFGLPPIKSRDHYRY